MQYFFYDTCSLLTEGKNVFNKDNKFYISNITFRELENIKTSFSKDQEIKSKAREVIRLLSQNEEKYEVINYLKYWDDELENYPVLSNNDDSKIILIALLLS